MFNMWSCCWARLSKVSLWSTPCGNDVILLLQLSKLCGNTQHGKSKPCSVRNYEIFPTNKCTNNLLKSPGYPPMWTQVRFNSSNKLHRDMQFPNFDYYRKDEYKNVQNTKWSGGDGKAGANYLIGVFGLICGAYGTKAHTVQYVLFMDAPADVLALATIEIDISKIDTGACLSYKWRGKPLLIKNRSPADIALEEKTPISSLRDPETEEQRTIKREWLVVIGICTHLGCVPIANSGDYPGGFYCPCHGSHYDNIGRIRKGPAPTNMEVPSYKFLSDTLVLVGI